MRLTILIFLFPFLLFPQITPKYPSLLWKISGNGVKKPSYLYGTMHVSNRVAWYLSEQFFEGLKSVEVVGLETNPGEWLDNMEKTGELAEVSQTRNNNPYQGDFYKTAFHIAFPEKRMLQAIISYDPDIINGLLYRQNRNKENFEENTYIDLFIYQAASKLNKQVISLENFAQSEIKARLSSIPDNEGDGGTRNYYNNSQKIEDAYRDGNLDMLDSLSKVATSLNTQKYLIDDRNIFFAETMDSVLHKKTLFAGVGAAHLPGPNGVIELLRKKGYTVEPVTPKVSKKSNATRDKLDDLVKPVSFQKQLSTDSLFSVDLPGKLYPLVDIGNLKYFIHADMVNGNFYTIVRLKYLAPLFNLSAGDMQRKVDSLLFENIPGKILYKKELSTPNGIKGIEVANKTRRGDEQRYQIYFTDLEMIMFKLGGKHQYATGKDANQFFGSIKFAAKAGDHKKFSPPNGGFSVQVPSTYHYQKYNGVPAVGLVEDLYVQHAGKKQLFGIQHAIYNDFNYLEQDTFELLRFTKHIFENLNFKDARRFSFTTEQGFPSIRFYAVNARGAALDGKIIIKGVHYYLVFQVTEKDAARDLGMFDSFSLNEFNYTNPIKVITDPGFLFRAKDEVTENASSRFNASYLKAYEASIKKKDTIRHDDNFRSGSKVYYSPSSNEYVNIVFEKYSRYDYRDPKDLEKKVDKVFHGNNSMWISNKASSYKDGLFLYSCSLKDTATARAIKVQLYFKNGTMHEISAPYDTVAGLQGWTKDFMSSFEPLDSAAGSSIFDHKLDQLLADLSRTDTSRRNAANTALGVISMHKDYAPDLATFFAGKDLGKVNDDSRAQLFVSAGTLGNEKILPAYRELYKQYTDSFYLQLCLLKGLAFLKTERSYAEFSRLLITEPPLVGDEGTVADVFDVLHDSLELCRNFFPEMLKLTRYDEFRGPVYELLADLIHRKMISPAAFAIQKENILLDANLALKRYTPVSKQNSGRDNPASEASEANAKDLSELIRKNLEGLSNNNEHAEGAQNANSFSKPALINYATALAPFYKADEKVRQFFQRLSKLKEQDISMPLTIILLKNNVALNDTMASYYSRNKFTRAYFYSELEKEDLTKHFDKEYLSQRKLVESVIASHKQLSSFYTDKEKKSSDSLMLVAKVPGGNKYQRGQIYIFRASKGKYDDEIWTAAFVNGNDEKISPKIELVSAAFYVDSKKTEQENINVLIDQFSLNFRKRAQSGSNYFQ